MKEDSEFGYKLRQILNHGIETLDPKISVRLHQARQNALEKQRVQVSVRKLAGVGAFDEGTSSQMRSILAAIALSIGVMGTYYWNTFEKVTENEEIDSEILADELPPSIYLDRGFQAWLDRDTQSPSP